MILHMTTQSHVADASGRSARFAAVTLGSRDTRSKECTVELGTLRGRRRRRRRRRSRRRRSRRRRGGGWGE